MPKVSVIIPTYNRASLVGQAIDSVLSQTFRDFEVIVVDDGSADDTRDVLARYGEFIRYIHQENAGESVARNRGLDEALGEYIGFLDDDDVYLDDALETAVGFLDANPDIDLLSAQAYRLTESGILTSELVRDRTDSGFVSPEEVLLRSPVGAGNSWGRRDALRDIGGFDLAIRVGEDWDMALRIVLEGSIHYMNQPLVALRSSENQQSMVSLAPAKAARRYADHMTILKKMEGIGQFRETLPLAVARVRCVYGLNLLANEKWADGESYLSEALMSEPGCWADDQHSGKLALAYMNTLDDTFGLGRATEFARRLFAIVSRYSAMAGAHRRALLGEFFAGRVFKEWSGNGNRTDIAHAYIHAIFNNPASIANRGLHSVFVHSMFGSHRVFVDAAVGDS